MRNPLCWTLIVGLVVPPLLSPVASLAAESLFVVSVPENGSLQSLLDAGVVVSKVLPEGAIVFGDEETPAILRSAGCTYDVLATESASLDFFLVYADRPLDKTSGPLTVVYTSERVAVVSVPKQETSHVLELGYEIEKLFRTPMRLSTQPPRTWRGRELSPGGEVIIRNLVDDVSEDSLITRVLFLESFGTRRATKPQSRLAAEWIARQFRSYGLEDVQIQEWTPLYPGNVVATLPGKQSPEDIYIIGGHYDSIVHSITTDSEPGADDNASGTATVLECARVLASQEFASTIRFIAFSAEEYGLLGSEAYAARAALGGDHIVGMINCDMLGYRDDSDARDLDIIVDGGPSNAWLREAAYEAGAHFVEGFAIVPGKLLRGSSDQASFQRHGFDAILFHEDTNNSCPYIHTPLDAFSFGYVDSILHTQSTRVAVALLATLAAPVPVPVMLQSFVALGATDRVNLEWELSTESLDLLSGVHVNRALAEEGPYERVTPHVLPLLERSYADKQVEIGRTYWYALELLFERGGSVRTPPLAVVVDAGNLPTTMSAPFAPGPEAAIHIRYHIGPRAQESTLGVYDVRGRLVRTLARGTHEPGDYLRLWDRRDASGAEVARGVYIVHLRAANQRLSRKVVLTAP